jgi:hypothetical protein
MARLSTKRRLIAPGATFRCILDTCIWMASVFGPLPAEIIVQRNEAKPSRGDTRSLARFDRLGGNAVSWSAGPITNEGTGDRSRVTCSCSSLSRAERRQWDKLVRQLR